ncbi:ABC transporter permease subunit [Halomontanus rarus]|uniref:ABC transporter permease subunit n=1 Tax=Halomontanus rarus TaxID=3034020 RepID=UPI001A988256
MVTIGWRTRRLAQAAFTVWAVITISFVLIRLMPGNAMGAMMVSFEQQGMSPARARELVELRLSVDPNKPIPVAYVEYIASTLRGDLGTSMAQGEPVAELLAAALPWTLFVLSWSIFISFFIGISVGALMAYWEGGKLDVGLTSWAILMGSIPFYVLAILLLIFASYRWGLFPSGGRQPTGVPQGFNVTYVRGILYHAALPVFSMLVASGVASLGMRGNSIRVLGADYLRVARLRGLSDYTISTQYVARNAVLPMYTTLLISIGEMFGGSIVLEYVFNYRGLGLLLFEAYNQRDYALMMGGFVLITVAVVTTLFIADMTYSWVDPRAGGQDSESY